MRIRIPFTWTTPLVVCAVAWGPPAAAQGPTRVAITIDDVPWAGPLPPDLGPLTDRLLLHLSSRGIPATGFVRCDGAKERMLRRWLDAGFGLGNHTALHRDLNSAPLDEWLAEARSCHMVLTRLTGRAVIPFRYPMLHRGKTVPRRDSISHALSGMGAIDAPVSVDTSDWILARFYRESRMPTRREEIGAAYVEHVTAAIFHAQAVARERLDRDIRHVVLLHANALAADYLGDLVDTLRARGVEFISLEEALEDPVYRMDDDYAGPKGLSWLYRIAPAAPDEVEWDDRQAQAITDRFGRAAGRSRE